MRRITSAPRSAAWLLALAACSAETLAPRPVELPSVPSLPIALPAQIHPRRPAEPLVVALFPGPHFVTSIDPPLTLVGFGLAPHEETAVQGPAGRTSIFRNVAPFDDDHALVTRADGTRALLDRNALTLLPLGSRNAYEPAGPGFLVGIGDNTLALVDRTTGKELATHPVSSNSRISLAGNDRLLEYETSFQGDDGEFIPSVTRLLALPSLAVIFETDARTVLRLPSSSTYVLDAWKKGGSKAAPRWTHELRLFDASSAKVTETIPIPREAGDLPYFPEFTFVMPRHAFDVSPDGRSIAMAWRDGLWSYERKTKRWKMLRRPPTQDLDDTRQESYFNVWFTPSGESVCSQRSSGAEVFPPRKTDPTKTLHVEPTAQGCVIFETPKQEGFEPLLGHLQRYCELTPQAVSPDGKLAVALYRENEPAHPTGHGQEYRATVVERADGRVLSTFPVGRILDQWGNNCTRVSFTKEGHLFIGVAASDGGMLYDARSGGVFEPRTGERLGPAVVGAEPPSFNFNTALARIGLKKTEQQGVSLEDSKGALVQSDPSGKHLLPRAAAAEEEPPQVDDFLWLEGPRVTVVRQGKALLVYHVPPGPSAPGLLAALVLPGPHGAVTLLAGGGFHLSGEVPEGTLGCLAGESLSPLATCKERFFVEDGLRRALSGKIDWLAETP
ncbi:MAG: hypothetical protein ABJE95_34575 [Byssovorax sp.]